MVAVVPRQLADVDGHVPPAGQGDEKFLHQLRVKGPDLLGGDVEVIAQHPPAGEVNGGEDQGLVHRQEHGAVAGHAPLVPQGLGEGVPQADANVLHRVVVVHAGVALAPDGQVEPPVPGEQGQHVVQKAAASVDLAAPGPVQVQGELDVRLRRPAGYFSLAHHSASLTISWTRSRKASICVREPMVTRHQSAISGLSQCRTSTPRAFSFR